MSDAPERIWISSQAVESKWVDKTIPNPIRRDEYYDIEYIRKYIADKEKQEVTKHIQIAHNLTKRKNHNRMSKSEMIMMIDTLKYAIKKDLGEK